MTQSTQEGDPDAPFVVDVHWARGTVRMSIRVTAMDLERMARELGIRVNVALVTRDLMFGLLGELYGTMLQKHPYLRVFSIDGTDWTIPSSSVLAVAVSDPEHPTDHDREVDIPRVGFRRPGEPGPA